MRDEGPLRYYDLLELCLIALSLLSRSNATGRSCARSTWRQTAERQDQAALPTVPNPWTNVLLQPLLQATLRNTPDQKVSPRMGLNEFYFRQPT